MHMKYRIGTAIAALFSIGLWHSAAVAQPQVDRFEGTILELLLRTDGAQALVAAVEVADEAGCLGALPVALADPKANPRVVFAPSNNAFEKFLRLNTNALAGPGADRIDEIKAQLPALLSSLEVTEADLCELLSNHVAELDRKAKKSSAADLLARGSITVSNGKTFPISVGSGGVVINYETSIKKEILTRNGSVLFVEDVIQDPPPPGDNVVTIFLAGQSGGFGGDFNGNPGLAGADAICQSRAETSGLGGTSWTAWLSDSNSDAIDRIPDGDEYRLVDGTLVADDKADLTDGTLKAALDQTQYGSELKILAWTGTRPDGRSTGSNCNDWTSTGDPNLSCGPDNPCGTQGITSNTDASWTELGAPFDAPQSCGSAAGLYCFGILD